MSEQDRTMRHLLDHGDREQAWRTLLRLESAFLIALFVLLTVLLVIAFTYRAELVLLRDAGVILWMSFTTGAIFHHFRHLRQDEHR